MSVLFETQGHTAVITLNRPEARNAVNADIAQGIEDAIDKLEADENLWTGVLTHTGSVFCAGADLKIIAAGRNAEMITKRGGFAGLVLRERTKPLIAAIDGPTFAGGTEIMLACDLRVASNAAQFGLMEVKRGLVAAAGGLHRLPRALPQAIAMEIALTGEPISAERAHEHGLVNELVEDGQALEAALALAERLNANSPLAVRASRQLILAAHTYETDRDAMRAAFGEMQKLSETEDFAEGPRAFIEKRDPQWKGR